MKTIFLSFLLFTSSIAYSQITKIQIEKVIKETGFIPSEIQKVEIEFGSVKNSFIIGNISEIHKKLLKGAEKVYQIILKDEGIWIKEEKKPTNMTIEDHEIISFYPYSIIKFFHVIADKGGNKLELYLYVY